MMTQKNELVNKKRKSRANDISILMITLLVMAILYWISANWPDIKAGIVDGFRGRCSQR